MAMQCMISKTMLRYKSCKIMQHVYLLMNVFKYYFQKERIRIYKNIIVRYQIGYQTPVCRSMKLIVTVAMGYSRKFQNRVT